MKDKVTVTAEKIYDRLITIPQQHPDAVRIKTAMVDVEATLVKFDNETEVDGVNLIEKMKELTDTALDATPLKKRITELETTLRAVVNDALESICLRSATGKTFRSISSANIITAQDVLENKQ